MKTVLLVLAMLFPVFAIAADQPAAVAVEAPKVFKVVARGKNTYYATGFFVGPTRVLTAAHTYQNGGEAWLVKDGREVHCKILKIDFKADIALLECSEVNATHYELSSVVQVIGYAYGKELVVGTTALYDDRLHLKTHYVPGMSGGPLVNERGDVVGMSVQCGLFNNNETCKAIPASALVEFLRTAK